MGNDNGKLLNYSGHYKFMTEIEISNLKQKRLKVAIKIQVQITPLPFMIRLMNSDEGSHHSY